MCTSDFSNTLRAIERSGARAFASVSAAWALSFIPSPSWPVRMSLPRPDTRVASMKRMSPPVGVQARPVATPGTLVRIATSFSKRRGPRIAGRAAASMRTRSAAPSAIRMTARRADQPFQVAHAGLARVVADDDADRVLGDLALLRCEAARRELAFEQVALRDLKLFLLGVAGYLDDLHAVADRARNGVQNIGGRDEHHLGKVEGHGEIVVAKRGVLLGVEHLEKRRGRIAMEAHAQLVHLVEHHDWIARARLADRLDDVSRQGADIGAPVAPDLGLVVHAAETEPREFAPGRPGDALAERCLADARRADEAENRAFAVGIELADGKIFENAALDLGKTIMVFIENAACLGDVDIILAKVGPGQLDQPLEIGADHRIFGRRLRHPLEPLELLPGLFLGLLRHPGLFDRRPQLGDLGRLLVSLAELLLDLPELLAQQMLALLRRQRLLRLFADFLRQPEDLDELGEHRQDLVETLLDVDGLENFLLLGWLCVDESCDEVSELRPRGEIIDCRRHFAGNIRQQLDRLAGALLEQGDADLDLRRHHLVDADLLDARHLKWKS